MPLHVGARTDRVPGISSMLPFKVAAPVVLASLSGGWSSPTPAVDAVLADLTAWI